MNWAIEVKGLKKTFVSGWLKKRRKEALRGVTLSVPEGAFWGLLGPNGAGKTTLLSIISNLLIPEQGEVRVLGKDLRKMVIVYLLIEVFAMKAALQRAMRAGLLLKLSE